MPFDLLKVTDVGHDDGPMYPATHRRGRAVVMEPTDGAVSVVPATGLAVGEVAGAGIREISRFGPVRAEVLLTDARVVVAPVRLERGAALRQRPTLVGHVRYGWLRQVGTCPHQGVRGEGQLRLILAHDTGEAERLLALDLTLPRHVDVVQLAQDVIRRAARFRLRHTDVAEDQLAALRALADAPRLAPVAKCLASYTMPSYLSARSLSVVGRSV